MRLSNSSTRCAVSVNRASRSGGRRSYPSFNCRSATIVTRFAFPVRSPIPLIVPCTCVAPACTATIVFATPHPVSSWVCMPNAVFGIRSRTVLTASLTSNGSDPPFVSHSTTRSAPASAAARRHSSAYFSSSRYPSKKCSASKMTRLPCATRCAIDSPIIARFSARVTFSTVSACAAELLPTSVTTGTNDSASTRNPSSCAASFPRRRVIPNATISAFCSRSCSSSSNSSSSFGLDAGNPASIMSTPSSSSARTTRTFSAAVNVIPPPPMPSRRVASYNWIVLMAPQPVAGEPLGAVAC